MLGSLGARAPHCGDCLPWGQDERWGFLVLPSPICPQCHPGPAGLCCPPLWGWPELGESPSPMMVALLVSIRPRGSPLSSLFVFPPSSPTASVQHTLFSTRSQPSTAVSHQDL